MAKNYTFAEAVRIINENVDMEAIADIGRRYPIMLHKVTKVVTKAGEDFVELMSYMPEYLTANKVNTALKALVAAATSDEVEEADESGEENAEATEASETAEVAVWDESMSAKQLWDILGKAGKRKLAKSTKKADLVEACKQAFGASAEVAAEEVDEEDEATEAESTESNPYEGKSAMDLFKECKKRGIKAAPKKPAKYYIELLVKADAEAATESESESEDEDWGDEESAEETKSTKNDKKAGKKAAKKAEKPAADDDDDWDI